MVKSEKKICITTNIFTHIHTQARARARVCVSCIYFAFHNVKLITMDEYQNHVLWKEEFVRAV